VLVILASIKDSSAGNFTDIQLAPAEDETLVANKDFDILLMLIRGIELTFSSQTSKTVCIKS
jgi:hypothetical protein